MLFFAAAAISFSPGALGCGSAHASDTLTSDYCYLVEAEAFYSGVPALYNTAVRIPVPASTYISQSRMDARGWDLRPIQGSLSNETDILVQDLASATAGWWFHLPTVENGQTKTIRTYMGSPEQKRNNGILHTGNDSLAATDDPVFDISDNLTLDVEIELFDSSAIDATLASHYNTGAGHGYRLLLVDDLGTLKVRAQADVHTCDLTFDTSWVDSNQLFTMRFAADAGNDLFIDRNGSVASSCDTDLAAISNPAGSPDFESGNSLDQAIIREIRLIDNGTIAAHWGFHASDITETSWADPVATGTVQDQGPNNLDITYTFNRDQSVFTASLSSVQLTSAAAEISLGADQVEVLGSGLGETARNSEITTGIFYSLWVDPIASAVGAGSPRDMGYAVGLGGLGMVLMLWVFNKTRFVPLAIGIGGVPPAIGVVSGWIAPWWMLLWGILIIGSWFANRQAESA